MAVRVHAHTLKEFLALPERKPALEFADGVITQKSSPKFHHSALQADLVERLNAAARPGKLGRAFPELRVSFAGVSRVPDVVFYRWARIPVDDSGFLVSEATVPPDLTVEIVSPEQSVNFLVNRCVWYVAHGVELALLVDPADLSVSAFRAGTMPVYWRDGDRIDLGKVLPGFTLTVEQLFDALRRE
jgi:Uma2 family endonuclease